ncbi:MAG: hypothetical protein OIF57_17415 [Marinobacterium sp.]|nr:hypothetical protein [Marinobacterium sp.]
MEQQLEPAAELNFECVDHFGAHEWPGDALAHVDSELVLALDAFRDRLGHGVVPSPVVGGWYRLDGSKTSRHYAVGRLSDAGDVFPRCDIRKALMVAQGCDWFGGIGVYLDTTGPSGKPEPMLHLDLRPGRVVWLRYEGRYIYPLRSAEELSEFWQQLSEVNYEAG